MHIYDMYVANDSEVGFWVKRQTWGDLCARVTHVGELEPDAYRFVHPSVRADLYQFSSGQVKQANVELLHAGSPTMWRQIPPPSTHVWRQRKSACHSSPASDVEAGRVANAER